MPGVFMETNRYWDAGKVAEDVQQDVETLAYSLCRAALSLNSSTLFKSYIGQINSANKLANQLAERLGRLASYYFSTAETYEVNEQVMILTVFSELNVDYTVTKLDGRDVIISGDPEGRSYDLDYNQTNGFSIDWGDCGVVSVLNLLKLMGYEIDEKTITKEAKENDLANYDTIIPWDRGETTWEDRIKILEHYGIESAAIPVNEEEAEGSFEETLNMIAAYVESGRGVILSLDADVLNGGSKEGKAESNHAVLVTGVVRDVKTGEVIGLYICDSGRAKKSDACRYVSADRLKKCMYEAKGTTVGVTKEPVIGKNK